MIGCSETIGHFSARTGSWRSRGDISKGQKRVPQSYYTVMARDSSYSCTSVSHLIYIHIYYKPIYGMNIPFVTFYNHLQLVKGFNSRATKIMERSLAVLTW